MNSNGQPHGKSNATKNKKETQADRPGAKPLQMESPKELSSESLYEEEHEQSAEFKTDENGDTIDSPTTNKKEMASNDESGLMMGNTIYPEKKLTPAERENLVAHMIHCDEVFESAFSEFEKAINKRKLEWDYFWDDLSAQETVQYVLAACRDLHSTGLKPSDENFTSRLEERSRSVAHDVGRAEHFIAHEIEDDMRDCLSQMREMQGLNSDHGLKLLQRQLQVHAKRQFEISSRHGIIEATQQLQTRLDEIEALVAPQYQLASERLSSMLTKIEQHRGKSLHGLKTGLSNLDDRTRGFRGLTMICAPPGQGKTVLATEIALGVLQHHEINDCAVLVLSLEMTELEMTARILSRLSGLHESVIYIGDNPMEEESLDPKTKTKLDKAIKDYEQLGQRLMLIDAAQLQSRPPSENQICSLIGKLKKTTHASQVLIVVDYLQLMDTGGKDGLQADRHQFQQLQNLSHAGHTVLAISESRKPASSKDPWTTGLADIKGDGRLGYGASAVILMRPLTPVEIARCYSKPCTWVNKGKATLELTNFLKELDGTGKVPVCLFIDKMRAPGKRGSLFFEFDYLRNQMKPLELGCFGNMPPVDEVDEDATPDPAAEV
ncbi:DnaB-like helicase C-terminal domain-containing protein [Calycomorphotria hydatis]|uniref:Replicative DNA helicase n=1 Tax=Calycomorphotria hydatis TaxID=2528027 RepID=A0A517T8R7_9PLAN|nr:DnaB-like helicase C-terminal domain-containing protein [Calycomorphotria hydatis]QDT64780.1 Replicative DNA helicase [Calycomorphotria hydatis]